MEGGGPRDDLIAQGLHFLQTDSAAASSPLSTRIAFLEKKGFSASEINETLSRLGGGGGGGARVSAFRGLFAGNAAANWVVNYVVIPLAVLGTGLLVYNLTGGEEVFPKPDDGAGAALAPNSAAASGLAQRHADEGDENDDIEDGALRPEDPPPLWARELLRMTTALGEEMQAIRARLDEQAALAKMAAEAKEAKEAATAAADEDNNKADTDDKANEAVPLADRLAAVFVAACNLKKASPENTEALQKCAGALAMYIRMLLEQPDIPRYRRISTSNDSFRTLVQAIEGHDQLLESVGFAKRGLYFEWMWADGKGGAAPEGVDRARILTECLALLESLRLEGAAAVLRPADIVPMSSSTEEELADSTTPAAASATTPAATPTTATIPATTTIAISPTDAATTAGPVTLAPPDMAAAASTFEEILRAAKVPKA